MIRWFICLHDVCLLPRITLMNKQGGRDGQYVWHVWGKIEMHTRFWWVHLKEGERLEDLCLDVTPILKCILTK